MPPRRAEGFTLVELLITIAIIGVLAALLAVGVQGARESARRTTCINHQQQIAQAALVYETSHGRFPGWREQLGDRAHPQSASWLFALLPFLERNDLYRAYLPGGAQVGKTPREHLAVTVCPSDFSASTSGATSYAANCGMPDGTSTPERPSDWPANGIFHDADWYWNANKRLAQVHLSDIAQHDGAANTLLLAERVEASGWADWASERQTGLVWQNTLTPGPDALINGARPASAESMALDHVRPSSGHPGGALVAFADGHAQFVHDEIEYLVYCLLMTTDGAHARDPQGRPLDERFVSTPLASLAAD